MKKAISILLVIVMVLAFLPSAFAADFDYQKVLGSKSNYSYDKFNKSWKYYEAYVKNYSDGCIIIGMDVSSEDGGSNPIMTSIYAKILDNNGNNMQTVTSLAFLIGDDLYSYDSLMEMDTSSTTLLGEQGQLLIKALAECDATKVAVKVGSNRGDITIDMDSSELTKTLKEFCSIYTKNNIWDYYTDKSLTETLEAMYPLYINGVAATKVLEEQKAA